MPLLINWHKCLQPFVGCCWNHADFWHTLIQFLPVWHCLVLVYFGFVLGALSNRLLNLFVSHVFASEGGSVASSGSWWAALLFGPCVCPSCSSRTGQIKLKNIQLLTQRCWSSPQVYFYILHFMQNISGLEIGTVAQSPYFVINRGMIFHGSTAVV